MSPELFEPEKFCLKHSRPTKSSDCYAFGMVIYEVLSGLVPFSCYKSYAVASRVLEGERPRRPQGAEGVWFTDDIWGISERCWVPTRDDRPSIEYVLQVLEEASSSWMEPPHLMVADLPTTKSPAQSSSDLSAEGSTEESGISALSCPAQSYLTLPPKGDADDSTYTNFLTCFQLFITKPQMTRALGCMWTIPASRAWRDLQRFRIGWVGHIFSMTDSLC